MLHQLIYSMQKIFTFLCCALFSASVAAQADSVAIYSKDGIAANRTKLYRNIVNNTINKSLSLPLADSTEETWRGAFWGMELIRYQSPWATARITYAVKEMPKRTPAFQRALLELLYTNYPKQFKNEVAALLQQTASAKIMAMCAVYLMQADALGAALANVIAQKNTFTTTADNAIYSQLILSVKNNTNYTALATQLPLLFSNKVLPGKIILYSMQRKNRNYPGMAIVRNADGSFVKAGNGTIFSVPQLARSITNLPGYLTNGNTPQGIFKMHGFDVSSSSFIGPTTNIQLVLPQETTPQDFLDNNSITDTAWSLPMYLRLLPVALQQIPALQQSFYAGAAGRTEIIAHGTTINPEFYKGQPYYPHTPSLGCLCTKEIWSSVNGKRMESNQQLLVNALQQAGGATGYCIVIDIDDKKAPVTLTDILHLLPTNK
jgi:hypothetical protein